MRCSTWSRRIACSRSGAAPETAKPRPSSASSCAGGLRSVARDLARAFSLWFRTVNLAEQVHRIRRRRGYFLEASAARPAGRCGSGVPRAQGARCGSRRGPRAAEEDTHRAGVHRASHRERTPHHAAQEPAHRRTVARPARSHAHAAGAAPELEPGTHRGDHGLADRGSPARAAHRGGRARARGVLSRRDPVSHPAGLLRRARRGAGQGVRRAAGITRTTQYRALRHLGGRRHGRQPGCPRQDHPRDAGAPAAGHHQCLLRRVPESRATAVAEREPQRRHTRALATHRAVRHADSRRAGHHARAPRSHAVSRVPRAGRPNACGSPTTAGPTATKGRSISCATSSSSPPASGRIAAFTPAGPTCSG